MKISILFIFISVSIFAQQTVKTINSDSLQMKNTVNLLLQETGKEFNFLKSKKTDKFDIWVYQNQSNTDEKFSVYYYKSAGTSEWIIKSIAGNFTTIFPLWQKFGNPKSDPEKLKQKGSEINYGTPSYTIFTPDEGYWVIRF